MYASDPSSRPRRAAAATPTVFAYGLRTGAVRLLARAGSERALAKGHGAPLADLAFGPAAGDGRHLLASADDAGVIGVWGVSGGGGGGALECARAALVAPAGARAGAAGARVAWHPAVPGLLAASVGGDVMLLDVAAIAETAPEGAPATALALGAAGVAALPGCAGGAPVTALAFSPTGAHLAAGRADGSVLVWGLPGGGDAADAVDAAAAARPPAVADATGGAPVIGAEFVPVGGRPVLVVAGGGAVTLWEAANPPTRLAALALAGAGGAPAALAGLAVGAPPPGAPGPPLVLVSAVDAGELVALTLAPDGRALAAAARFGVATPVLSTTLAPGSPWATALTLQADAVQLLSVDAAACAAAAGLEPSAHRPAAAAVPAPKAKAAIKAAPVPAPAPVAPPPAPSPSPKAKARAPPPPPDAAPLARLLTPSSLMGLVASPPASDGGAVAPAAARKASPAPPRGPRRPLLPTRPPSSPPCAPKFGRPTRVWPLLRKLRARACWKRRARRRPTTSPRSSRPSTPRWTASW